MKYASERLCDDKRIVIAALQNTRIILRYAFRLKNDKDILMAVVQNNWEVLRYVSETFKKILF